MRASLLIVSVAAVLLSPSLAATQEVSPTEYDQIIAAALSEYGANNYEEAYALFTRAHALRPSARTERALGKTSFELRQYIETIRWLEASLADERSPLEGELRAEVEALLLRARTFVGTVVVHSATAGAQVEVDTAPVEGDPSAPDGVSVRLDLGTHEIRLRAEGHQAETRRLDVRGGESTEVQIDLIPLGAAATATAVVTPDPVSPPGDPGATMRDLGYVSIAGGGAFAILGVVSIAMWADAVGALNANLEQGYCFADADSETVDPGAGGIAVAVCRDLESRYRLALPLAWTGFVGAGVLLGVGIGLAVGAPGRDDADQGAWATCGPFADAGVMCMGAF